jgi:hypothetical protein
MAVTGWTILVGNCGIVAVAVTVVVGVGVVVWVGVTDGVCVGVLLGGSVGVTRTKSASMVTTSSGDTSSDVETGITTGEGVGLSTRVGATVVGANVTSCSNRGPVFTTLFVPQAANTRIEIRKNNGLRPITLTSSYLPIPVILAIL